MQAKITHLHGMTRAAFEAFKANQGKDNIASPWHCSDRDGMMYFYSVEKHREEYEDESDVIDYLKNQAYSNAQIQAVIQEESEIIILCLNLENVDSLQDDNSCINMHYVADCADIADVNMSNVIEAYSCKFNKWLSPFVLRGLLDNEHFNSGAVNPDLLACAKAIDPFCITPDSLFDFPELTRTI